MARAIYRNNGKIAPLPLSRQANGPKWLDCRTCVSNLCSCQLVEPSRSLCPEIRIAFTTLSMTDRVLRSRTPAEPPVSCKPLPYSQTVLTLAALRIALPKNPSARVRKLRPQIPPPPQNLGRVPRRVKRRRVNVRQVLAPFKTHRCLRLATTRPAPLNTAKKIKMLLGPMYDYA